MVGEEDAFAEDLGLEGALGVVIECELETQ
jgi:hypothetical protein